MTADVSGLARRRRFRAPTYVNLGLSTALLALFLLHLTTQPTTSPPTIAEISPQAVAQIKKQPPQQATKYGTQTAKGTKNGNAGGKGPGTGPGKGPGKGPGAGNGNGDGGHAFHQCVGNPPRQTEDPQSPPCVAYWTGDNGGATSMGVTKDTITVVAPTRVDPVLVSYFNFRYEFYGRKIVVQATNESACDTAGHQAAADTDVQNWHPFAAGYYFGCYGIPYYTEMARKKVVSVASYAPIMGERLMSKWHPYMWQYGMDTDLEMENIGDWACRRLVGRPAKHAGTSGSVQPKDLSTKTRKWALVRQVLDYNNGDLYVDTSDLERRMRNCGVQLKIIKENQSQNGADLAVIQELQGGDYTTVICACTYDMRTLLANAEAQQYHPEWVVSSVGLMDTNYYVTPANPFGSAAFPEEQRKHMMGLTFQPRQVDADNSYPVLAQEQTTDGAYIGYDSSSAAILNPDYRWMLLLASGIQMAGPHLTPDSFARGLQKAEFPNPENLQRVGEVGFASGRHGMTIDGAELWWGEGAHPPFPDTDWGGSYCYSDHGRRYKLGEWPTAADPFFTTPCDSGGPGSPPGSPMGKPGTGNPP